MSQKEVDRYGIIKRIIDGKLNATEAAKLLHLSTRQVRRMKSAVVLRGAKGLVHGNRGKPGNRRLPEEKRKEIIDLLKEQYPDFKPTFACEKLREVHQIIYDPKTIRAIQMKEGLWKSRRKKIGSEHRSWRQRRSCYGEMEQFDGSYEHWFEERGPKCCLLASIDDATGRITKATFGFHEGVVPVFTFWKEYLEQHGKPRSIYLDKFSTYKMNCKEAKDNPDVKTQFQRVAEELQIELIFAHSPQAKGRVERLFETLQDRLIKEFRLAGVSTLEEGNIFLEIYLPKFNEQFGVEAMNDSDLHNQLTKKELDHLPSVFSRQEKRTVQNDFTISYKNVWYQFLEKQPVVVAKRDEVTIQERLDGSIHIRLRGKYLAYKILPIRPIKTKITAQVLTHKQVTKPSIDHPWRKQIAKDCALSQLTH